MPKKLSWAWNTVAYMKYAFVLDIVPGEEGSNVVEHPII